MGFEDLYPEVRIIKEKHKTELYELFKTVLIKHFNRVFEATNINLIKLKTDRIYEGAAFYAHGSGISIDFINIDDLWIVEDAEVFDKLIKPLDNNQFYELLNLDELEDFLYSYKCLTGKKTFVISKDIIEVLK